MKHLLTITDMDITGSNKLSHARPRIAVNAVLFDADNNIALSYMGKYDLHTLPGGGVEPSEDFHTAIKREIWEEAGCECEIIGELGQIIENRSEHDFTQERYYYIARVAGEKGNLHLTDEEIAENTTVVWFPIEQSLKIITEKEHNNYQRKFIQKRDITALTEAMLWIRLHDIPGYNSFVKIESIFKGLSSDKKYYIETTDGQHLLLRVNDIAKYDRKKAGYERMQRMDMEGVPVPRLIDVGVCNNGKNYYLLTTWFDGDNVKNALPLLSKTEQYVTGLKIGAILRKIHAISAPENIGEWYDRYIKVINERLQAFLDCGVRFDGWENIIRYYKDNCCLLKNRPQTCLHGDFHAENLLISGDGAVSVIDWQICDFEGYGDPWDDFRSDQCEANPHFATGCINGYFDNEVPVEFWDLNAFYMAIGSITSIPWAYYRYPSELEPLIEHNLNVLRWFDNMNNPVPTWYLKDFYVQWIDGIPYKLKAPFDFSFLSKYGKVFKALDEQGSGNISFGIQNGDKRYFVKFAGSPMPNYIANRDSGAIDAASAIMLLKKAVPLYTELAHPTLISIVSTEEIGGGYAAVFEWEDAVGIEPKGSPDYIRFMQMPMEKKMKAFEDIVEFHAHVAAKGFVALDFYDGSILYDYEKEKVIVCDIDLYQKAPFINTDGLGLVGSARYVSPEECVQDAIMDEITNVYTMGATAFALFAYGDRSPEAWTLSPKLYAVVKKAVSAERGERQQSIKQFIEEWRAAK